VQLLQSAGEWIVRVIEGGEQTAQTSFELQSFAAAYAEGQRMRLGLDGYETI
jgi:hypothetical protein